MATPKKTTTAKTPAKKTATKKSTAKTNVVEPSSSDKKIEDTPSSTTPVNAAPQIHSSILEMSMVTANLYDIEELRVAAANRLRILVTKEPDSDGIVRGFGYDLNHPSVVNAQEVVNKLDELEKKLVADTQKSLKATPFAKWCKDQRGVGEKQLARLLSVIGDPYWRAENVLNTDDKDYIKRDGTIVKPGEVKFPAGPRRVSQLWAYCGLHTDESGAAVKRRKGQKANWNQDAKKRAWLIIDSCMKQIDAGCKREGGIGEHSNDCTCSIYRVVVDNRRLDTLETHPDWTPGHSLNDAKHVAMQVLIKDLWQESKRIHEGGKY